MAEDLIDDLALRSTVAEGQGIDGVRALNHGRKLPHPALLAKMYTLGNMSLGMIAEQFGVHKVAVHYALKRIGVERRTHTRGRSGGPRSNSGRKRRLQRANAEQPQPATDSREKP